MPGFVGRAAARLAFSISAFKNKKGRLSPAYSRFDIAWRCISILLATQGMDWVGARIYKYETDFIRANPGGALDPGWILLNQPQYVYWFFAQGALIGIAFWRLLELYWFAKDLGNKKNRAHYAQAYGVDNA